MATWRSLEQYAPFAQILVRYMWEARPPLNPNQFAIRAGLRRQILSQWLNAPATAELHPDPTAVVKVARAMGVPVTDLLIAAGHGTAVDPLLDRTGAWAYILQRVEDAPSVVQSEQESNQLDEPTRQHVLASLRALAAADAASLQAHLATSSSAPIVDAVAPPDAHSETGDASEGDIASESDDSSNT